MENSEGLIKVFISGVMPKKKYSDANELAKDIADILAIEQEKLVVELINLPDLQGEQGLRGERGTSGPRGPDGPIGPAGATGTAGTSLTPRGPWDVTATYNTGNIVENGGTVYVATTAHSAAAITEPGTGANWVTVWQVLVILPAPLTATSITLNGGTSFDTYIEGTWVPAVTVASGTAPTFTTTATGTYTQIGNIVHCKITLVNTVGGVAGAGAGLVSISIPVASSALETANTVPAGITLNDVTSSQAFVSKAPSVSVVDLKLGTPFVDATGTDFDDASIREIKLEFSYFA